jgi:hypothetical protein
MKKGWILLLSLLLCLLIVTLESQSQFSIDGGFSTFAMNLAEGEPYCC